MRDVTEKDFRQQQYYNAKIEDYEFREDGKIVRKDRFSVAINKIALMVGAVERGEYEVDDVVKKVKLLQEGIAHKNITTFIWHILTANSSGKNFNPQSVLEALQDLDADYTHWVKFKDSYKVENVITKKQQSDLEALLKEEIYFDPSMEPNNED